MNRLLLFIFIIFLSGACQAGETAVPTGTAVSPTATLNVVTKPEPTALPDPPTPTAVPTLSPVPTLAQVQPEPAPTALPTKPPVIPTAEPVVTYGRTPEGAFFQGAMDAPLTLIDYSDFL